MIGRICAIVLLLLASVTSLADTVSATDVNSFPPTSLGSQPLRGTHAPTAGHAPTTVSVKPLEGLDLSRVGGALFAVIVLIFLLRWCGKFFFPAATGKAQSRVVEVVSRAPLAPKQQVMLLRVGKRLLVVGDSAGQLSTLSEITDPDEVASMVGQLRDEKTAPAAAFGSLFGRFSKRFDADDDDGLDRSPVPIEGQTLIDATDETNEPATAQAEIDTLRNRVRALAAQFKQDADPA